MPALVSVIIPTYNRAATLERALSSVITQTYQNIEIIIIDDGSTDNTASLLSQGAIDSSPFIYLKQKHKGVSPARNKGISQAKGEFIAFLDSDDEWLPKKLERQIEFMQNNPSELIVQSDELWIRNGKKVNPHKKHQKVGGKFFSEALNLCLVTTSSVLCRKELFEKAGVFDEKLPACEDYDWYLRIMAQDIAIPLIPEKLLTRYGGHEDQLSVKYWGMDRFRIKTLVKLLNLDISKENKAAARKILKKKLYILSAGARKRAKLVSYLKYWRLMRKYC